MYELDFKYFKNSYDKSMEEMFAAVSDLYAKYCNDFFHFAQFENNRESWETAFKRTHNKYMRDLKINKAQKILELACGRGGFVNIIAQHTEGEVLGIDISKSQLSHTNRFKRKNLRFKHHDIMKVDELNEKFDAAVFLDAACYLPDKNMALKKIAKILNPGARLLIVDWCKKEGLNRIQEELVLHPFMKYWAIPGLETQQTYRKYFEINGFKILKMQDLNSKVRRNWEFGYKSALKGIKELSYTDLVQFVWKGIQLGPKSILLIKEQFPAAIYIKVGYDVGFLRYTYFLVEKS